MKEANSSAEPLDDLDPGPNGMNLIFAGRRWGKDYRPNAMPRRENGEALYQDSLGNAFLLLQAGLATRCGEKVRESLSEDDYFGYLAWLADHLHTLDLAPRQEQADLCRRVHRLAKSEAIYLIGVNGAFYEMETADISVCVMEMLDPSLAFTEQDLDSIYAEVLERRQPSDDEVRECHPPVLASVNIQPELTREEIRRVIREEQERARYCLEGEDVFFDVGWRIPLAAVLKGVKTRARRIRLLDRFFTVYGESLYK